MGFNFDTVINRRGTDSIKWGLYEGNDIIPMWVADMDFASPPTVLEAIHQRVDHGIFGYPKISKELNTVVQNFLEQKYNWAIDPDWIVWLPGLVPALNLACRTFCKPHEPVLTTVPIYPPFITAPGFSERKLNTAPLLFESGRWHLDLDELKAACTPDTRLFIACNPYNPMGRVFTPNEMGDIAKFCLEHDIILCSDEIHCELILDNIRHHPVATLSDEIADNTITLMAPSKTFNIPGLCCAFAIISNTAMRTKFLLQMRGIMPEMNNLCLVACQAAYEHGEPWRLELLDYLRGNRDFLEGFVAKELPGVSLHHIEATYLAFMDMRETGIEEPKAFFEKAGVGLSDGLHFRGEGFMRLNFGCPHSTLKEGLSRMRKALVG